MKGTIEDIVRSRVTMVPASRGWFNSYCEVCGDGRRIKGPRGGWNFVDAMAFYHCFNCGAEGSFDPDREFPYGKDMRLILDAYGIPEDSHKKLILRKKLSGTATTKPERIVAPINPIEVPDYFYKLSEANGDDVTAIKARDHLIHWRNIDPNSYEFYLSSGITTGDARQRAIAMSLKNRLIIPAFKDGKMIYFQAMALDKDAKIKYLGMDSPRGNIIYNYDSLYQNFNMPLFVTEGFFDAFHLRGVSVMENKLTTQQVELLRRSPRQKVIVPDRKGDSRKLAEQAVKLEWAVSIPDIGSDCKDIDDAIRKFGKLYVIQSVMQNIREGNAALGAIKLYL